MNGVQTHFSTRILADRPGILIVNGHALGAKAGADGRLTALPVNPTSRRCGTGCSSQESRRHGQGWQPHD